MNKSKSKYPENDEQIRRKILQNTMLYNDNRKSFTYDPPASLLKAYQKQQPVLDANTQTDRNMKFKLDQLQDKLSQLSSEVHLTRQQYRELLDYTNQTKSNLVYEHLLNMKVELQGNIQGLSNQIRIGRQAAEQRYSQIRKNCTQIWDRSEQLRENVFSLTMRIEALEQKMGFKQAYRLQYL